MFYFTARVNTSARVSQLPIIPFIGTYPQGRRRLVLLICRTPYYGLRYSLGPSLLRFSWMKPIRPNKKNQIPTRNIPIVEYSAHAPSDQFPPQTKIRYCRRTTKGRQSPINKIPSTIHTMFQNLPLSSICCRTYPSGHFRHDD